MERAKEKREDLQTKFSQRTPASTNCWQHVLFVVAETFRIFSFKVQLSELVPALLGQNVSDSKGRCPVLCSGLPLPDFPARGWVLGQGQKNLDEQQQAVSSPKSSEKLCAVLTFAEPREKRETQ